MSRHSFDDGVRLDQLTPDLASVAGAPLRRALAEPAGSVVVSPCDAESMSRWCDAWADLVTRALEPDVFMEPGFALAAAQHFAPSQRPTFLLAWAMSSSGTPSLIGLCAIQGKRGTGATAVWTHQQATTSAPLLDRERAGEALDALLGEVVRRSPGSVGLLLAGVRQDGPLMRLLEDRQKRLAVLEHRTRAILTRPEARDAVEMLTPKRAKELRRQRRKLAQGGTLVFRSAREIDDVRAATERFLDLEARGWKGARGTALLSDPGLATFTRTMTRLLAREGKCAIHTLELDGRPIAMGIVLRSGDRAFFWKTAYDEAHAGLSPGKLFTRHLTDELAADAAVVMTDSCAMPDHPMIDRLWRERMIVADVLVAPEGVPEAAFERAVRRLVLRRRCRQWAKTTFLGGRRLLARMRSR